MRMPVPGTSLRQPACCPPSSTMCCTAFTPPPRSAPRPSSSPSMAGIHGHACAAVPALAVHTTAQTRLFRDIAVSQCTLEAHARGGLMSGTGQAPAHDATWGCQVHSCMQWISHSPLAARNLGLHYACMMLIQSSVWLRSAHVCMEQSRACAAWRQMAQWHKRPCCTHHHAARAHRQSGSPYSASLQSDAVAAEASTLKNFARNSTYPYFLGRSMHVPASAICCLGCRLRLVALCCS